MAPDRSIYNRAHGRLALWQSDPRPVSVDELRRAVLALIVERFGYEPLDIDTARRALALAAFDLIQLHLRESAKLPR